MVSYDPPSIHQACVLSEKSSCSSLYDCVLFVFMILAGVFNPVIFNNDRSHDPMLASFPVTEERGQGHAAPTLGGQHGG